MESSFFKPANVQALMGLLYKQVHPTRYLEHSRFDTLVYTGAKPHRVLHAFFAVFSASH